MAGVLARPGNQKENHEHTYLACAGGAGHGGTVRGLTAAPAGAATTAAGAPCIDAPGDATCDGVSPYQLGKNGISYWPR